MHCGNANPVTFGDFHHSSLTGCKRSFDFVPQCWVDWRTPEPCSLFARSPQASVHAGDNHAALKLGKYAQHLKHRFARWRACIKRLLMQVQIDTGTVYLAKETNQILETAAQPIHAPCGNHVEFAPRGGLEHPIKCRALIATLCAANSCVCKFFRDFPSVPLCRHLKLAPLVLDALSVRANAQIESYTPRTCHLYLASANSYSENGYFWNDELRRMTVRLF